MYSKSRYASEASDFIDAKIIEYQLIPTNTFTFDIERMQQMISSPSIQLPDKLSFDEFCEWIKTQV